MAWKILARAAPIMLFTFGAGTAVADAPAPPVKDWTIETVVVTAKAPGPAFWHVTLGSSDVWILGTVGPIPRDLKWDTAELARLLDHAHALYLPPRGEVGIFEGVWFLIWHGDVLRLPDGQQLESILPAPLRDRFVRARNSIHRNAERYAEDKPSVAGFRLEGDFLQDNNLTTLDPNATIEAVAAHMSVPVRTVATYPALDVVKEVPSLSSEGNLKCLTDALDDIDTMGAHARLAAAAWATGDLDAVKAHYFEPEALDCLGQSASFTKLWQRSVDDTVATTDAALKRPGKTVLVVNIGEFLRRNGVLERLKAQGLQIEGPAD